MLPFCTPQTSGCVQHGSVSDLFWRQESPHDLTKLPAGLPINALLRQLRLLAAANLESGGLRKPKPAGDQIRCRNPAGPGRAMGSESSY